MHTIGVFYGSTSGATRRAAEQIWGELLREGRGADIVDLHDIRGVSGRDLAKYDVLILGAPTWHGGELQDDWEAFTSELDEIDLSGKTVALFGLGDQVKYPAAFADALGTLYEHVKRKGANVIGRCPTHGTTFTRSSAVVDDEFVGLVLDDDNQPDQTPARIARWVKRLLIELG